MFIFTITRSPGHVISRAFSSHMHVFFTITNIVIVPSHDKNALADIAPYCILHVSTRANNNGHCPDSIASTASSVQKQSSKSSCPDLRL